VVVIVIIIIIIVVVVVVAFVGDVSPFILVKDVSGLVVGFIQCLNYQYFCLALSSQREC
jgi:hypothetical protein